MIRITINVDGETIDALEAQLEAVTRERDRYKAALEHIVEHVQPGVAVNIAREALKGAGQ